MNVGLRTVNRMVANAPAIQASISTNTHVDSLVRTKKPVLEARLLERIDMLRKHKMSVNAPVIKVQASRIKAQLLRHYDEAHSDSVPAGGNVAVSQPGATAAASPITAEEYQGSGVGGCTRRDRRRRRRC